MYHLKNFIKKKNNIYSKFVKCKKQNSEEFYHNNCKNYRNLLSTLLKRDKSKFRKPLQWKHQRYKENSGNYKNFNINKAKKNNDTPSLITKNKKYINDPVSIANTFNNFFTFVAEIVQSKVKFSNKSLRSFLPSEVNDFFIITATNKEEIYKIISSLNSNKSSGPNSIPAKVLHLLQNQISNHLATICNLSFSTGVFLVILKTAKVIPFTKRILN